MSALGIDILHKLGVSVYYKMIDNYKKKLVKDYPQNDYYNIHEKRRSDSVSLSTVKYIAAYISKPITICIPIPFVFNNVDVHNLLNIDTKIYSW
ncbi:5753_t:CDS:2 [Scutellospora calospora]|uniref:5753_t:CDS:1 n=1 Tax=Scutellospora calospora TaxID=85575 RepID=A0ACA9KX73_9GLOM|nr:5753_t:CDS:2 [Scutellospora calospora]